MSVVVIGGNDCMATRYKDIIARQRCSHKCHRILKTSWGIPI